MDAWQGMRPLKRYSQCFICGDKNPFGLNVEFYQKNDKVVGEYIVSDHFQGYKNILHGGILSALLDEVMIKSILAQDILTLTCEIKVRFRKPVKIGQRLFLEGKPTENKGRILLAEGKIRNEDDEIVATAEGKFFKAEGETEKL
ncbi:MAG: PaaI family thioesterase, partial [candidate division Zixibacteria bacterium]|nr:PaaI family thioesterase [candidate division Zixibacteria bacterium]